MGTARATLEAQALLEMLPIAGFAVDADCRYLAFNDLYAETMRTLYGSTPRIGASMLDLLPDPALRESTKQLVAESMAGESDHTHNWMGAHGARRYFSYRYSALCDGDEVAGVLFVTMDETDLGLAREQQARIDAIMAASHDIVVNVSVSGMVTTWSDSAQELLGYEKSEIVGKSASILFREDRHDQFDELLRGLVSGDEVRHRETTAVGKDGSLVDLSVTVAPVMDSRGAPTSFTVSVRDITDRKTAEREVQRREVRYRGLFESANDAILVFDIDGLRITEGNAAAVQMLGYSEDELKGLSVMDLSDAPEATRKSADTREVQIRRRLVRRKDGSTIPVSISIGWIDEQGIGFGYLRDLTPQEEALHRLENSETRFATAFKTSPDAININRLSDGLYLEINDGFTLATGYSAADVAGKTSLELDIWADPADRDRLVAGLRGDGFVSDLEARFRRKDGTVVLALMSARIMDVDGEPCILSVTRDISGRKLVEADLEREVAVAGALAGLSTLLVKERLPLEEITGLTLSCARSLTESEHGFLALVGDDGVARLTAATESMFAAAPDEPWGEIAFEPLADGTYPGLWGVCLNNRVGFFTNEPSAHPASTGVPEGHQAMRNFLSVPALAGDRLIGQLALANSSRDYSDVDVDVVRRIASVYGAALIRAEAQRELEASREDLERMVFQVTESMGRIVETRDPYTAGHQERVAALSRQIAVEMGLAPDQIEGIEIAALVHDIGKLGVPTEILTKPGTLTANEFAMIKEHSHFGYEILRDVEFPWPVAEIAWQHHERLDGTGYPRGLVGDQIVIGARILAVADVIEAMASHRPYRPKLDIEAAITEISSHPEKFDQQVIDACLALYGRGELEL